MATKCPKCGGTKVQGTNNGKRILAALGGVLTATGTMFLTRSSGQASANALQTRRNICPENTYICLNPLCRHMFSEKI